MGYEIKMIIGKSGFEHPEHERSKTERYDDNSGFKYLKDQNGDFVKTGRTEIYFSVMAMQQDHRQFRRGVSQRGGLPGGNQSR